MSGDTSHATKVRGAPTKYVKLNVGGSLHYTTIGTLTKHDNMLRAMFSGRMEVLTDTDGVSKFLCCISLKMVCSDSITNAIKFDD